MIHLDKETGNLYIESFLWYTDAKVPEGKQDELSKLVIDNLSYEEGEDTMRSIAQKYVDEGFEMGEARGKAEGKVEGKIEIAFNMLKSKFDLSTISKITGLSLQEVQKLESNNS